MLEELNQLLNDLYTIKDGIVSWLESAIEILEKLRNGGNKNE